jgi:F-type H+-transporting ATPase subunit gamma
MANIKDLKKKIKSTQSTLKITTAMKLVSAAKLNKAQQAIQGARPYSTELDSTIRTVSALVDGYEHSYFKQDVTNKHSVLLVISSDKGLCGGYNSQLGKKVKNFISNSDENVKLVFIGKKVKELVKALPNVSKTYTFEKTEPSFNEMKAIGQDLAKLFTLGEVGKVYVAYNEFKSAIAFDSKVKTLLPLSLEESEKESLKEEFPFDFKYEPTPKEILDSLLPETFISNLWTCLLDGLASEHGSRMASMDSATKNCKEMIKTLTLKMNKLRQASITTELIEVVSGAESLKN